MNKTAKLKLAKVIVARYLEASSMWSDLGQINYNPSDFTTKRKNPFILQKPNQKGIANSYYQEYYDASRGFKDSLPAGNQDLRYFEKTFYEPKDDNYDIEFKVETSVARTRPGVFDPSTGRVHFPARGERVSVLGDGRISMNQGIIEGGELGFMGFKDVNVKLKASDHAQHRMDERGISFQDVQDLISDFLVDAADSAGNFGPYLKRKVFPNNSGLNATRYWAIAQARSQSGFRIENNKYEFTFRRNGHQLRCTIENHVNLTSSIEHKLFYVGSNTTHYKETDAVLPLKLELTLQTVF